MLKFKYYLGVGIIEETKKCVSEALDRILIGQERFLVNERRKTETEKRMRDASEKKRRLPKRQTAHEIYQKKITANGLAKLRFNAV